MIHGNCKPKFGTRLNWGNPISQGMIGCWLFNESHGTIVYDSCNERPSGAFVNMAADVWSRGVHGASIEFNKSGGSADYIVTAPDRRFNGLNRFSAVCWVNIHAIPDANGGSVFAIPKNNTRPISPYQILFYGTKSDDSGWLAIYGNGSSRVIESGVVAVAFNVWLQVGFVYDGATLRTFINGVPDSTSSACTYALPTIVTNLYFGELWPGTNNASFDGFISSIMMWNRALSTNELQYLYAYPFVMFDSQKYWTYYSSSPTPPVTYLQTKMKIGGSWKTAVPKLVKVNGVWREITDGKIKISGDWKALTKS